MHLPASRTHDSPGPDRVIGSRTVGRIGCCSMVGSAAGTGFAAAGDDRCRHLDPYIDLYGCVFTGVDLSGKDLHGAKLTGAKLTWAKLDDASLSGIDLKTTTLNAATFWRTDLSRSNLS